ncbi:serine aminopeptidase domain-containing protein [Phenylobacterium sp.]|uniref:alpha/beta hydrolase family protein n=1 Tax=Phenylobacterium sp. TaxID=1871053 RepID=UPI00286A764B|nr:alpha/beta hydrolase [Phenylobacterium sp.]
MTLAGWTVALFLCLAPAAGASVGFQTASIAVAGDRPLRVGIWYPSDAAEAPTPLALSMQIVAPDAAMAGSRHPLIVISHGTGGSFADHFDTAQALARAGFIVVAVSHTGDTYDDRSRALRITERSGQLVRTIDYMTTEWRDHGAVDARRIGAFGFSSGGFTVLSLIGGEPDMALVAPHCREHPAYFDCQLTPTMGAVAPTVPAPVAHDRRVRAAVVAAPAVGFSFAPSGLAKVRIPVQLWRAEADTILPNPLYAEAVRGLLPRRPEYHVVPGADHFDFLPPCSDGLKAAAPQICGSHIDRAAFHATFNAQVVRFFRATLR